jgi:hypothetical protein
MNIISRQHKKVTEWFKVQSFEWWAGYFTVIYLGLITLVLAANLEDLFKLKLNELGDFLAGVFGPVAFLWLVLGYRQQGQELRVSSDALVKQSLELARSVEQQVLAQEYAAQQLKIAEEKIQTERVELAESIRPRVQVRFLSSSKSSDRIWLNLELLVYNSAAYDLRAECIYGNVVYDLMKFPFIEERQIKKFQFEYGEDLFEVGAVISVYCKNVRGQNYGYKFNIQGARSGKFEISPV